jgi:hyperosmotically inducible protein
MKFGTKLSSLLLAVVLLLGGCTAMTGETAGQNIDDATITAKVKSKLAADRLSNLTRVDVDTTNQVVALNGVVQSADAKVRAGRLAKEVSGVRKVENNLQVQNR